MAKPSMDTLFVFQFFHVCAGLKILGGRNGRTKLSLLSITNLHTAQPVRETASYALSYAFTSCSFQFAGKSAIFKKKRLTALQKSSQARSKICVIQ